MTVTPDMSTERAFVRSVEMRPGYDFRSDPDPDKRTRGCHGAELTFVTRGPIATVTFMVMTGWLPALMHRFGTRVNEVAPGPYAGPVTIHAGEPIQALAGAMLGPDECTYTPTGRCWSMPGHLIGETAWERLGQGHDALWAFLEDEIYPQWTEG